MDNEEHRELVIRAFNKLARDKYDRGERENGGDLQFKTSLELLKEIRDEAIDTFIYAQTAIAKLEE